MKLGAEPKKIAILGSLLAVALVVFYINVLSGDDPGPATTAPQLTPAAPAPTKVQSGPTPSRPAARPNDRTRRASEFRPSLKRSADAPLDPSQIDPRLQLDLLEKLQNVKFTGSGRNLFEFGAAPPPPAAERKPEPKIIPLPVATIPVETINTPTEPPKPVAPPIPLKFYGFVSSPRGSDRRGFFLDGEDIVVAAEGETIKTRYKVVRIGLNSVEMEDLQFQQRQTLRLEEQRG